MIFLSGSVGKSTGEMIGPANPGANPPAGKAPDYMPPKSIGREKKTLICWAASATRKEVYSPFISP
jgi:hypothetical protein